MAAELAYSLPVLCALCSIYIRPQKLKLKLVRVASDRFIPDIVSWKACFLSLEKKNTKRLSKLYLNMEEVSSNRKDFNSNRK